MSKAFTKGQRVWTSNGLEYEITAVIDAERVLAAEVLEVDEDEDSDPIETLDDERVMNVAVLFAVAPKQKIDAEIENAQSRLRELNAQIEQANRALRMTPDREKALASVMQFDILHAWVTGAPLWLVTVQYDTRVRVRVHRRELGKHEYYLTQSHRRREYDMRGGEVFWEVGVSEGEKTLYTRHVFLTEDQARAKAREILLFEVEEDRLRRHPGRWREAVESLHALGMSVPEWLESAQRLACIQRIDDEIAQLEKRLAEQREARAKAGH